MRKWALVAVAACLLAAGVAGWLTLPDWYATWMPEQVGRATFPLDHENALGEGAERHGLSPALVAAVIYVESGFDESVRSPSGAVGLMQVMPSTADEIAHHSGGTTFTSADLRDPRVNVRYGCYYLRLLLERYEGSLVCALAAYNAGAANVDDWMEGSGGDLVVDDIPFAETREYVGQVLRYRDIYREVYGPLLAGVPVSRGLGG